MTIDVRQLVNRVAAEIRGHGVQLIQERRAVPRGIHGVARPVERRGALLVEH